MDIGILYPQTGFSHDPAFIADFARTAESLGFSHIATYEHVLGANPNRPGGLRKPITYDNPFLEPFVLFGFMSAVTQAIYFVTRVLVLPQRQTPLVAKQAATVDRLSNGRLRLGVGIGWNDVEYAGLNQSFHNRAKRVEEQVVVLRKLWSQPLVEFEGRWDKIPDAGINPLPIQRTIPIWFGGHADATLRRVARLGDGWLPNDISAEQAQESIMNLKRYVVNAGRDPARIGIDARLAYGEGDRESLHREVDRWKSIGATLLTMDFMGSEIDSPSSLLSSMSEFANEFL
jgi:probable F420-dependent oxidoreductase